MSAMPFFPNQMLTLPRVARLKLEKNGLLIKEHVTCAWASLFWRHCAASI